MTTLTIEIPDTEIEAVVKYLKDKRVTIKKKNLKRLHDLTIEDYRKDAFIRTQNRLCSASKYL